MAVLLPKRGKLISPLVGGRPPRAAEMPENEADWRKVRPCGADGESVAAALLSNLGKLLSDRRWWWPEVLPPLDWIPPRCAPFVIFFPRPGVGSLAAPTGDPDSDPAGDWPRFRVPPDGVLPGGETSKTRAEDAATPGMSSSHDASGSSFGSPRVVTTKLGDLDSPPGTSDGTGRWRGTSQIASKESFLGDDAATFENKRRGFIPDLADSLPPDPNSLLYLFASYTRFEFT